MRLYFPELEPWVTRSALLPAICPGLSVCECGATGSASSQTACPVGPTLRQSRSRHSHGSPLCPVACLRPSYWSGCMFLFYLLGVGLPCRSIFCQSWLCEEVRCVYLRRHLGSPFLRIFSKDIKSATPMSTLEVICSSFPLAHTVTRFFLSIFCLITCEVLEGRDC